MPQDRYTTTVELEAQQAAIRQILARAATLPTASDDRAAGGIEDEFVHRAARASHIARAYRQQTTA